MSTTRKIDTDDVTAVILAGGEGSRMGGVDKGLLELEKQPLIEHVIARMEPQLCRLIISANRNIDRYQGYGYPLISDQLKGRGPLAGILSARQQCQSEWLLSVPCDTPCLPSNLVSRICDKMDQTPALLYTAHDGQQLQPLFSMIHRDLTTSLAEYLASSNRKAALWLKQQATVHVDFSDQPHAFFNINTPAMLAQCSTQLKSVNQH